eukprot:Hpha_TRINITY_DN16210_c0_g5::TRINITY_DN16210_c0_g5_i4::g.14028::m.14028
MMQEDNMYKCVKPGLTCSDGDATGWAEYIRCEEINESPERAACTKKALKEVSGACSTCVLRVALQGLCSVQPEQIMRDVFHGTDQSLFSCTAVRTQCLPRGTQLTPPPVPDVPNHLVGSCSGGNVHDFVVKRVYSGKDAGDCVECMTNSGAGGTKAYKCFDRTVLTDAVCSAADREAWKETASCLNQEEKEGSMGRRGAVAELASNTACGVEKGLKTSGSCMACMLAVALSPGDACEGWTSRRILSNMTDALLGVLGRCQKVEEMCIQRNTDHMAPIDTTTAGGATPPGTEGSKSGLGFGSILVILLAVGLVGYCGIGVALNVAHGENTFPQVLPNWDFWSTCLHKLRPGAPRGYLGVAVEDGMDAENDIIDVIDDAPEASSPQQLRVL